MTAVEKIAELRNRLEIIEESIATPFTADGKSIVDVMMADAKSLATDLEGIAEEVVQGGDIQLFDTIVEALDMYHPTKARVDEWQSGGGGIRVEKKYRDAEAAGTDYPTSEKQSYSHEEFRKDAFERGPSNLSAHSHSNPYVADVPEKKEKKKKKKRQSQEETFGFGDAEFGFKEERKQGSDWAEWPQSQDAFQQDSFDPAYSRAQSGFQVDEMQTGAGHPSRGSEFERMPSKSSALDMTRRLPTMMSPQHSPHHSVAGDAFRGFAQDTFQEREEPYIRDSMSARKFPSASQQHSAMGDQYFKEDNFSNQKSVVGRMKIHMPYEEIQGKEEEFKELLCRSIAAASNIPAHRIRIKSGPHQSHDFI